MSQNKNSGRIVPFLFIILLFPQSSFSRFIAIDPAKSKYPTLSPFIYTTNNPLKYIDPDGRETQMYSIPVIAGTKHTFIVVRSENKITSKGFYPESRTAASGNSASSESGSFSSGDKIVLKTDLDTELGAVKDLDAGKESNAKFEATIAPPDGMSSADFDSKVLSTADAMATTSTKYNILGPNSNTMANRTIEAAGGKVPEIPGAVAQKYDQRNSSPPNRRIEAPRVP